MYKLLLCWRYLLTRYLALVCIVSVMLGVATLIVVNSVMAGFSTKLRDRLHGLLSDVVIEAWDHEGFSNPEGKMDLIRADPFLADRIEAMTPTLEIFAMLQFTFRGSPIVRLVRLIGIDPEGRARLGGFAEHLVLRPGHPSFDLSPEAQTRQRMLHPPGRLERRAADLQPKPVPGEKPPPDPPPAVVFSPPTMFIGYSLAHFREHDKEGKTHEVRALQPGDDVILTTISGQGLKAVMTPCVVCDYFRSEMSEYDANFVFVPLTELQRLRGMEGRATSIQIRLKDYRESKAVVERLQVLMAGSPVEVQTWEKKQGPLLAAISIEKGILNVLLFLIIAVAGFGILAIFSMIVVEKTRDIGILKALGASNTGVLNIFLGYGLLLGVVGALFGTVIGVTFTLHINEIEHCLTRWTGMEVFPREVYYFNEIPTYIHVPSVLLVNLGAVAIAVVFSILPALRAALLHPVRALRYE